MEKRKKLIIIATDSEAQRNRLSTLILNLNYTTTTMSISELLRVSPSFSGATSTIILLDMSNTASSDAVIASQKLSLATGGSILHYFDTKNIDSLPAKLKSSGAAYITKYSTHHEIELAIQLVELKRQLYQTNQDIRRDQWASKALLSLYQETSDRDMTAGGVVGIIASVFSLPCCILAKRQKQDAFSVIAASGIKEGEIESYIQSKAATVTLSALCNKFMEIKSLGTQLHKSSSAFAAPQWEPLTGLITVISRQPHDKVIFCLFSAERRPFSENDINTYTKGAFFASILFSNRSFGKATTEPSLQTIETKTAEASTCMPLTQ